MKSLLLLVVLATALSGCAVIAPHEYPAGAYHPASPYDAAYPPAVAYGHPVYVRPPVRFSFGLHFRSGRGYHGHHHGFGAHRFRHGHGWRR